MNNETHPLLPVQKSEVIIGGSIVLIVSLVGLIRLGPHLPLFDDPRCTGFYFGLVPLVALVAFLLTIYIGTIGVIRFVNGRIYHIGNWGVLSRSAHLALLLPVLTIFAILGGRIGFLVVGVLAILLLFVSSLYNRHSFKVNAIFVFSTIILSSITFIFSVGVLFHSMILCMFFQF